MWAPAAPDPLNISERKQTGMPNGAFRFGKIIRFAACVSVGKKPDDGYKWAQRHPSAIGADAVPRTMCGIFAIIGAQATPVSELRKRAIALSQRHACPRMRAS